MVRVAPQQERSARRLAHFLEVAAELFAEVGYDAATMTAIAERSGASIGALYNYFPDKQSVAFTLLHQYAQEIEAYLRPLIEQAKALNPKEFAEQFIERITEFIELHPAYLALHAAPIRYSRDPAARKALRMTFANAFRAKNPKLSSERAFLSANVALQIVKGLTALYAGASAKEKVQIEAEFKKIMTLYLATVLA